MKFHLILSIFPTLNFYLGIHHIGGRALTSSWSHESFTSPSGASLHRKASEQCPVASEQDNRSSSTARTKAAGTCLGSPTVAEISQLL